MSNSDGSINIGNVSISGGANIIGKNEGGQHNTFGGQELGPGDLFDKIEGGLRDAGDEAFAEELIEKVVDPLEAMANKPAEEQTVEVQDQARSLVERLVPYAPALFKTVVTLGEAGLSALASTNPVVSILIATLRAAKSLVGNETDPGNKVDQRSE